MRDPFAGETRRGRSTGSRDHQRERHVTATQCPIGAQPYEPDTAVMAVFDATGALVQHAAGPAARWDRAAGAARRSLAAAWPDVWAVVGPVLDRYAAGDLNGFHAGWVDRTGPDGAERAVEVHVRHNEVGAVEIVVVDAPVGARIDPKAGTDVPDDGDGGLVLACGLLDAYGRLVAGSEALEGLVGVATAELLGRPVIGFVAPHDVARVLAAYDLVRSGRRPNRRVLCRLLTGAGATTAPCAVTLVPVRRADGREIAFVVSAADADDRARSRAVELEHVLRSLMVQLSATDLWPQLAELSGTDVRAIPELATLNARQLDIVVRIANGASVAEIAAALHVSPSTVRGHLSDIYAKAKVKDRNELLALVHGRRRS